MGKKTALVAGVTGLVGNELLHILLENQNYEKIYAFVRRPLEIKQPRLAEVICNFDQLEEVEQSFTVDDVFCSLGTTIKKAKTQEVMYRIDVDYPIALAKWAKDRGAKHFLIVSSMNANKNSKLFYPRMKGELEEKLKEIPYDRMSIFQPSLLLGDRAEFRLFEKMSITIVRGLSRISDNLSSKMGIEAKIVAAAMNQVAQMQKSGIQVYTSTQMRKFETKGK